MTGDQQEAVYTVTDYYDGVRGGIASYGGAPHLYESQFEDIDGGVETFLLLPVDSETFALALEDCAIWCRWDRAFQAGFATLDSHPALPEDRKRHDEIEALLRPRVVIEPERSVRAIGRFEASLGGKGELSSSRYLVYWTIVENARPV